MIHSLSIPWCEDHGASIESFLGQALSMGGDAAEAVEVPGRLDSFNARVKALIKALTERYDGLDA